jgi:RND family efflux transporter MFP subunit
MRRNFCIRTAHRALLLVAGGLLALTGCGGRPEPAPPAAGAAETEARRVQVVEAARRAWPLTVRVQGTLVEDESAMVGAKVSGRVREVLVDLGTPVEAGQVVARLDTEEFDILVRQAEAQVAQARATLGLKGDTPDDQLDPRKAAPVLQEMALLEDARRNLQRARRLTDKSVFTQEEVQARESTFQVAEARYASSLNAVQENIALLALRRAELALAVQNREDAVLKAPFAGIIQERRVAPGAYVNVGQPVVTLVRIDPLRFRAGVPERAATGVSVGQMVRLSLEGQDAPIELKISRISPSLDVTSRALTIEADLENSAGRWRSGLFAEAEILVNADQLALAVPLASVVAFGGVEKVWVIKDSRAEPRAIRTGRRDAQFVEIVDGLSAGDIILANGQQGREGLVHVDGGPGQQPPDRAALLR